MCVYFEIKIPLLSCRFDYYLTQKICSEIIKTCCFIWGHIATPTRSYRAGWQNATATVDTYDFINMLTSGWNGVPSEIFVQLWNLIKSKNTWCRFYRCTYISHTYNFWENRLLLLIAYIHWMKNENTHIISNTKNNLFLHYNILINNTVTSNQIIFSLSKTILYISS